jgi:hypothetical protein
MKTAYVLGKFSSTGVKNLADGGPDTLGGIGDHQPKLD